MKIRSVRKTAFPFLAITLLVVRPGAAQEIHPAHAIALKRTVGAAAFSPDLNWLAVGQTNGQIAVWDLTQGRQAASWVGRGKISFLSNANELLLAEGTNLFLLDPQNGRVLRTLESPSNTLNSLSVSRSGNVAVATAGNHPTQLSSELIFWNLADGRIIPKLPTTRYPWEHVLVRLINRGSNFPEEPFSMSVGYCQALSPDGTRFASGGYKLEQVDVWTLAGNYYNHYLGTIHSSRSVVSTSEIASELVFLDNRRLAVVYNRERLDVITLNTNDSEIRQLLPLLPFTARAADGSLVTGEVAAIQDYQARFQIEQMGFTPISIGSDSNVLRRFYYQVATATNTTGWQVVASVFATNHTEATAQFRERGLENGRILAGPEVQIIAGDVVPVTELSRKLSREHDLQERSKRHPDWALLQKRNKLIEKTDLEIRSLAASGDGRRLAVAGMRMAWRPGVFMPKGDGAYDSPVNAELQIWDAVEMKLLVTIKGRSDEKFAQVALDKTGGRVAAVTTGVIYNSKMTSAMQQSSERSPTSTRYVYVWELPTAPAAPQ